MTVNELQTQLQCITAERNRIVDHIDSRSLRSECLALLSKLEKLKRRSLTNETYAEAERTINSHVFSPAQVQSSMAGGINSGWPISSQMDRQQTQQGIRQGVAK